MLNASSITGNRRRLFHLKQNSTAASAEPGKNGLELRCSDAVVALVVTVIVVQFTRLVPGVTVVGEKPQETPAEQLNDTAELKPATGATVTWIPTL